MVFDESPAVYEGEWQDGCRHGHGTLWFDAGKAVYYEGRSSCAACDRGRGPAVAVAIASAALVLSTDACSTHNMIRVSGEWVNDMKQGQGTMVYPSGNTYTGQWAADVKSGHGVMVWLTKAQRYSGQWERDLPNGLGEHTWEQPDASAGGSHATCIMPNRYRGSFLNGQRHGEGALLYSSGARYEGGWVADRKEGDGVYVFEDGTVFEGRFVADRPDLEHGTFSYGSGGGSSATGGSSNGTGSSSGAAQPAATGQAPGSGAASGFGPRVAVLQLYIDDLLGEEEAPAAAARAVVNLLTGFNSELRRLYDRYWWVRGVTLSGLVVCTQGRARTQMPPGHPDATC